MFLVLEVIGSNSALLGEGARVVFTAKGGTIGRRAGNDWVLADPHVSGRHARVRSVGGTYFLEDAESANGVLVNGVKIHQGEPYPLKDGDSVFIDPFEIAVRMTATMPGAATELHPSRQSGASPDLLPPSAGMPQASGGMPSVDELLGTASVQQGSGSLAAAKPAGGLDDLLGMDAGSLPADFNPLLEPAGERPPAATPPTGRDLYGKPVINDAFSIRAPAAPMPGGRSAAIPTNWDSIESPSPVPAGPNVARPAPPAVPSLASESTQSLAVPGRPSAGPVPAASSIEALLRGAGISETALSPEVMAQLGQVLRIVIEGLMEVLRARGEIKNEFRLQQTTFKPRENNPLKFSVNAEDAIHNLLVKRNAAYLDTPSAFEDAFGDVRSHQMAMLAGMRSAFDHMLAEFDPATLRARFDAKPGRKVSLTFGSGGRNWENFEEFYRELTADGDDCFRRLFGDEFGRSYEEQLKRLRALK